MSELFDLVYLGSGCGEIYLFPGNRSCRWSLRGRLTLRRECTAWGLSWLSRFRGEDGTSGWERLLA